MSAARSEQDICAALDKGIQTGIFPDPVAEQAKLYLMHLRDPVRLSVMGLPGTGKSTLTNFLTGASVVPEGIRLPSLWVVRGERNRAICTLRDGTEEVIEPIDAGEIAACAPVFVRLEMRLPALDKISVLEVVMGPEISDRRRALGWAARRTDIAIWCSQAFDHEEQELWSTMPDRIKDHAFLVISKADELASSGILQDRLADLGATAAEDFQGIYPIATLQALDARAPDGSVDKAKLTSSGGRALIGAILRIVEQGRQSALDNAGILLRQYQDALSRAIAPTPAPPPAAATPMPEPDPEPEADEEKSKTLDPRTRRRPRQKSDLRMLLRIADQVQVAQPVEEPAPEPEPEDEPAPEIEVAAETKEDASPSNVVELHPETREAFEKAVGYLANKGQELAEELPKMGPAAPKWIIDETIEIANELVDQLGMLGMHDDPALAKAAEMSFDAADLLQLMQIEKEDNAAVEALAVLLQMKREFESRLAA
ncbi:hypothetical protein AAD018_002850 [Aestuariibius insulae]|uniref:hypothetical protein n=1 Tax=Aestuariibius insulae TaxID=2058287 RepID=UPI00345E24EF